MLWVFDINETMLDISPLEEVFAKHAGEPKLRLDWFDLLIHTALVTTAAGAYRDFAELGAACARAVALAHGTSLNDAAVADLGAAMRSLPAHPDTVPALSALRERGERLVALGNSPHAVVETQLRHAGLIQYFDGTYSAQHAGALKPARAAYDMVLSSEGVSADRSVMVAAHDWDIAGAQSAGMRTAFVARAGRLPLPGWPDPDVIGADLIEATAWFGPALPEAGRTAADR